MKGLYAMSEYAARISRLIDRFPLPIDKDIVVGGRTPTSATSEFLTNKEQGDWAERLVVKAINESSTDCVAVRYGRADSIAAGDPGFPEFYAQYQEELNDIGKKPDVLLFRAGDEPQNADELNDPHVVGRAIAAIEVRSSSFLCNRYRATMEKRNAEAERRCAELQKRILADPYASLLKKKNPAILDLLRKATASTFRELTFRAVSWSSTKELRQLSELMKDLKANIALLHKRDYLSITPKLEDIALVNRWISKFNVPHYYLQVFFDSAYMISFEKILSLCCDSDSEGKDFSIETDVKNQQKTTIKVNIDVGNPVIGRIDMPAHFSAMKELDRGRLLFYVKFDGGQGYLDMDLFRSVIGE